MATPKRKRTKTAQKKAPKKKDEKEGEGTGGPFEVKKITSADIKDQKITKIPPLDAEGVDEVEFHIIREPFSYVRITLYKKTHEYTYNVIEPQLTKGEEKLKKYLINQIIDEMDEERDEFESVPEREKKLRKVMNKILDNLKQPTTRITRERLFYYMVAEFIGFGKINAMMDDSMLEDISCDGTDLPLYVFHRQFKNIKTNVRFKESKELEDFVVKLAQLSGKSISISNPVLDATLPDGSRLNQTLGTEVTTRGSSFTIRKFKEDPITISDLVGFSTLSAEMAAHLWLCVQFGESMICSGGTASGKTTTLNAVSHLIPPSAKIITIEDTREMNLPHENWIAGLTRERKGTVEGSGGRSIDMYALLVAALRQRPEYMLVGEVRGKETMAVFQAMATGQITYSTIHADSVTSIVRRLENPPINIPRILILGLNLIILQAQVKVKNKRTRRIKELVEIIGVDPTTNEIITNTVFKWIPAKDEFKFTGHSKLYEKIMDRENLTADEVLEDVRQRTEVINWMVEKKVRIHKQVASIINEYYRDPIAVVKRIRKELVELAAQKEAEEVKKIKEEAEAEEAGEAAEAEAA
ncbi:MAG: type II/IV secretion system ATPase subunit [Thermoplasmata archaeon]|nr:MAG: type II/IV secretion system ATPase subunit [Thermoplasmata archaeon]